MSSYIQNILKNDALSVNLDALTSISHCDKGMHVSLGINSFVVIKEGNSFDKYSTYDFLYLFELPNTVYVDVFEVESRFDFPWHLVNIHSISDNVDYESIAAASNNKTTLIGIEFLSMPLIDLTKLSSDSLPFLKWSYQLPIHLRYQQAVNYSNAYSNITIKSPKLYVRSYLSHDESLETCDEVDFAQCSSNTRIRDASMNEQIKLKKRYKRYYDISYLGNIGNSNQIEVDLRRLNPGYNSDSMYQSVGLLSPHDLLLFTEEFNVSMETILHMPVGNVNDSIGVIISTIAVTSMTTLILLAVIAKKLFTHHVKR